MSPNQVLPLVNAKLAELELVPSTMTPEEEAALVEYLNTAPWTMYHVLEQEVWPDGGATEPAARVQRCALQTVLRTQFQVRSKGDLVSRTPSSLEKVAWRRMRAHTHTYTHNLSYTHTHVCMPTFFMGHNACPHLHVHMRPSPMPTDAHRHTQTHAPISYLPRCSIPPFVQLGRHSKLPKLSCSEQGLQP